MGVERSLARAMFWLRSFIIGLGLVLFAVRDPSFGDDLLLGRGLTTALVLSPLVAANLVHVWARRRPDHLSESGAVGIELVLDTVFALGIQALLTPVIGFQRLPIVLVLVVVEAALRRHDIGALLVAMGGGLPLAAMRALDIPDSVAPGPVDLLEQMALIVTLPAIGFLLGWAARSRDQAIIAAETANRRTERANRRLTAFAHTAAHELRAPLATTQGFASLLRDRLGPAAIDDPILKEALDRIDQTSTRMRSLIDGLLTFAEARERLPARGEVDLNEALDDAIDNIEALITGADATVERAELPTVSGDRVLLTTALQNLVRNAIDHGRRANLHISVRAHRRLGGWAIEVEDDGVGMDPQTLAEALEPLRRGPGSKGSGLGLATVATIAEVHGGEVLIDSRTGVGTLIAIHLPPAEAPAEPETGRLVSALLH